MKVSEKRTKSGHPVRHRSRTGPGTAALALLTAVPLVASAARLDYELGAALLRSDNIGLSQANRIVEEVLVPHARVEFEHDTAVVQASFDGEVQYLDYRDDTYDDDLRGQFAGRVNWIILPDRVSFEATNSLSRQSVSTLTSFSPGNEQQINVLVAGPSLYARLGATTLGELDLRYTNSYAEKTDSFNSDRFSAAGRLQRRLNPTDQLTLSAEGTRVEFDRLGPTFDYDRYDVYVTYRSELSSIDLDIDAGYTRLKPRGDQEASTGPLFRGSAAWRVSPRTTFDIGASYQFADAAQNLILQVGAPGTAVVGVPDDPGLQIVPDLYQERRASLGYRFEGERLNLQVRPYYARVEYLDELAPDQDNQGAVLDAAWRLRPNLTLLGVLARHDREFRDLSRTDRDTNVGMALVYQIARHWSGRADLQRRERDSDAAGQSYVENVAVISVTYRR